MKEGLKLTLEKKVTPQESASQYGSGTVEVFATPAMIAFMEQTALKCVAPHLEAGTTTVGIGIDIKHLKATPINMKVKCQAIVTKIDGKKITFQIEAWDEMDKIGTGTHIRYVIDIEQFSQQLEEKKKLANLQTGYC
ncbi:MAG: thioesterase family protein [Spirochaetes bacterium]|nr:thioesterase family protein [Spirochaetota bacterium]